MKKITLLAATALMSVTFTAQAEVTLYHCEMGNTVGVFQDDGDTHHAVLKWNNKLVRVNRVTTTTGAIRYEGSNLVWIRIPNKSMLLDSGTMHQLANECRTN